VTEQVHPTTTVSPREGLQETPEPPRDSAHPVPEPPAWVSWTDEQLLDLRFNDLKITIEGSWLEPHIAQLAQELEGRGLAFRPHFWLSDEWFTPDGITGIAIPFYLAHPRLMRLEERQMLEVEGGTPDWCMKILRHEAGHAIDNAYHLQRRRKRQKLFGRNSEPYPEYYAPKPYSKSFVLHLDMWYAQSHPAEDFAETFAVWLTPDAQWRTRYADWPALKKLEYLDELMREIAGRPPAVTTRAEFEPLSHLRRTLRQHYRRKRAHYGLNRPDFYDRDLRRLFTDDPGAAGAMTAARFVTKVRKDVRRRVAAWTGSYQYTIDQVLEDIITRCRELKLRLRTSEDQTRLDFTALLTVQTMNYLHSGRHRVAL
jgi:hypothetical protein